MTASDNNLDANLNFLVDDHIARAFQRSFDDSMALFDGKGIDVKAATATMNRV